MIDLSSPAFRLALRGLHVFPLSAGSKQPLPKSHGFHDATAEVDATRARWLKTPNANIGIACGPKSNLWVLDCDAHHGGKRTVESLIEAHGALPLTVAVATPRGGFHLWFRWPTDGTIIRNSIGKIGPGLDVRGEGGYVVGPPSRLSDGRGYAWVKGPSEILPAPEWLVRLAAPPRAERQNLSPARGFESSDRYICAAVTSELRALAQAREGTRNDTLNRAAFALAGFVKSGHLPERWARQLLEDHAVASGLSETEARRTIQSAFLAATPRELPR